MTALYRFVICAFISGALICSCPAFAQDDSSGTGVDQDNLAGAGVGDRPVDTEQVDPFPADQDNPVVMDKNGNAVTEQDDAPEPIERDSDNSDTVTDD